LRKQVQVPERQRGEVEAEQQRKIIHMLTVCRSSVRGRQNLKPNVRSTRNLRTTPWRHSSQPRTIRCSRIPISGRSLTTSSSRTPSSNSRSKRPCQPTI
jgi:hypothetical protein